jgi:hypothetical protein
VLSALVYFSSWAESVPRNQQRETQNSNFFMRMILMLRSEQNPEECDARYSLEQSQLQRYSSNKSGKNKLMTGIALLIYDQHNKYRRRKQFDRKANVCVISLAAPLNLRGASGD